MLLPIELVGYLTKATAAAEWLILAFALKFLPN